MPVETIYLNGALQALHIRPDPEPKGIEFFTTPGMALQVARMVRPAGYVVPEHYHNPIERTLTGTPEVLYVKRGGVLATFGPDMNRILWAGDWLIVFGGPHGFSFLVDSEVWEVKQGPFYGSEKDKVKCS